MGDEEKAEETRDGGGGGAKGETLRDEEAPEELKAWSERVLRSLAVSDRAELDQLSKASAALRAQVQSQGLELESSEKQVVQMREQLTQENALQSQMVPRSELALASARADALKREFDSVLAEVSNLSESRSALQQTVAKLKLENESLRTALEVRFVCCVRIAP